ncbi:MAG: response regulator [Candidatus Competibacteraceae bacterium]
MPVRHVLVVDDSKSARLMLRKMLQGFSLTVDTVDSAEEALNYLRGQRPDAIFMDHTMPGMDGLTAVRQIRSNPANAAFPVAMYTSKEEAGYLDEARAAGAIGVLIKPAVPETLGALLEQMHAAFDAAQKPTAPPAPPPAPIASVPAPTGEAATVEWVEKVTLEKAEQVFYEAIESQVLPLINDVVAKLRRDLEASQEQIGERVAARVYDARLAQWQPPSPPPGDVGPAVDTAIRAQLPPLLESRLETLRGEDRAAIEGLAREVATEVCQNQLHELSERLVRQLSARFAEATQKAGVVAREAAMEAFREATPASEMTTADSSQESVAAAAQEAAMRVWGDAQRGLRRRIYLAAAWAAAAGIGAAVLAYALR